MSIPAIDQSVAGECVVSRFYSPGLYAELYAECEHFIDRDTGYEFRGEKDGRPWCVNLNYRQAAHSITYDVCETCWAVFNDADVLDEDRSPFVDALNAITPRAGTGHLTPGNTEPRFSWVPCGCCASKLAGYRYELVAVYL